MRLIALALTLLVSTSHAEGIPSGQTAGDLQEDCKSLVKLVEDHTDPTGGAGDCLGYLSGVTDAMYSLPGNRICLPPTGIAPIETARVFVKYTDRFPASTHSHRFVVLFNSLEREYPCKAM